MMKDNFMDIGYCTNVWNFSIGPLASISQISLKLQFSDVTIWETGLCHSVIRVEKNYLHTRTLDNASLIPHSGCTCVLVYLTLLILYSRPS